jgi:membrane-bound inhibitor of C-type lysozyme
VIFARIVNVYSIFLFFIHMNTFRKMFGVLAIAVFLTACTNTAEEPSIEELEAIASVELDAAEENQRDDNALSDVEKGMVDFDSCVAGEGDVIGSECTTFDGRVFGIPLFSYGYVCDDDKAFAVQDNELGSVFFVTEANRAAPVLLNPVEAGSGVKYANETMTLHMKADMVYVDEDGVSTYVNCALENISDDSSTDEDAV